MLSLFSGAMDLERRPDGVLPVRFSPERLKEYRASPTAIYGHCTAGVRLDFVTGAPAVSFRYHLHTLFYPPVVFDVFEDGKWTASIREPDRSPGGEIVYRRRKQVPSRVTVYLPVHGETVLSHLEPGDSPRPAPEAENRLLVVSDSIGQGFLGSSPAGGYVPQLARSLGWDFYNLSVGGELHRPELIEPALPYRPTAALIALGTNDLLLTRDLEKIRAQVRGFYAAYRRRFPCLPTWTMTPLWMAGLEDGELEGLFCQVTREITQTAAQAGCRVLQGLDLLPHQPRFFTDSAHPNDLGHTQLALGLLSELKRG